MPNVNVTYEEMRQAATRLNTGKTDIVSRLEELQRLVTGLVNGGYVTDSSSKQFESAYANFTQGAKNVVDSLEHMGNYLNTAAKTFEDADLDLATRLRSN